jgi:hypothetical protein
VEVTVCPAQSHTRMVTRVNLFSDRFSWVKF